MLSLHATFVSVKKWLFPSRCRDILLEITATLCPHYIFTHRDKVMISGKLFPLSTLISQEELAAIMGLTFRQVCLQFSWYGKPEIEAISQTFWIEEELTDKRSKRGYFSFKYLHRPARPAFRVLALYPPSSHPSHQTCHRQHKHLESNTTSLPLHEKALHFKKKVFPGKVAFLSSCLRGEFQFMPWR